MIIEPLSLIGMTVITAIIFTCLAVIWTSKDMMNVLLKIAFIVMSIWCGMNAVVMLWFS